MYSIYKISGPTNKVYIGYTSKTIETRFNEHKQLARSGSGHYLKRAIRKYGEDAFNIELINSTNDKMSALEMEINYINDFNSFGVDGYNMTSGGEGSDWSKGKTWEEMYGIEKASEMKNKISGCNNWNKTKDLKGDKNGFYGKNHTVETKKKITEASLNRKHSTSTKLKCSETKKGTLNPMYGKTGNNHHASKSYLVYNPIEEKEVLIIGGIQPYLRQFGITFNTLINFMNGITPKRNKAKYENTSWKIQEVKRVVLN